MIPTAVAPFIARRSSHAGQADGHDGEDHAGRDKPCQRGTKEQIPGPGFPISLAALAVGRRVEPPLGREAEEVRPLAAVPRIVGDVEIERALVEVRAAIEHGSAGGRTTTIPSVRTRASARSGTPTRPPPSA